MSKHRKSSKKVWNLEIFRGFDRDFREDQVLVNRPIREFLDKEDKFVLVGGKGLGKTLFLRYKSYLYHTNQGESIKFNPYQNELSENLNIRIDTFSKDDILKFKDLGTWTQIWETAIWTMVFRLFNLPIHQKLDRLLGDTRDLSNVLSRLLNIRSNIEQLNEFILDFQEHKNKIQSAVALFIDDFDQNLHTILKEPRQYFSNTQEEQSKIVDVWVNAQIGLLAAIYNINRQNAHIKVYATIRREAYEAYDDEVKINYKTHVSILEYSKDDIKQIFIKNIDQIDPKDLIDRWAKSPIARFIGFDRSEHRFAQDINGNRRSEDAFDFIYRHTLGRPREIVMMGDTIDNLIWTTTYRNAEINDRIELVRAEVNEVSQEILRNYLNELVPNLEEDNLKYFAGQVRSNVIPKADFRLFDADLLKKLFNFGLVGIVKQSNHNNLMVQSFNPAAMFNYRSFKVLPNTDFLLIHSAMDYLLLDKLTYGNFYNPYNIISDGYDFFPKIDNPIHDLEHYFPKDLIGNRWNAASEAGGHVGFPLKDIYANFFNFEKSHQRHDNFQKNWRTADIILGLLGRICFSKRLEKQFQTGFYQQKMDQCMAELQMYSFVRPYNADLPDATSETALDKFLDKIIGRYIVLGCYLVLDMRIEWIHALLRDGQFEFVKNEEKKDNAYSHFSRSFFIRDLKKDEPRNPKSLQHKQIKQHIFNHLSAFEQESLAAFVRNACDELNFLKWCEKQEHKEWLKENVLSTLWKPMK